MSRSQKPKYKRFGHPFHYRASLLLEKGYKFLTEIKKIDNRVLKIGKTYGLL